MNLFTEPEQFKVITLWQPFATLLAAGVKKNETRPKETTWQGTYLIHAAKGINALCKKLCGQEPFKSELAKLGFDQWKQLPLGSIIGSFLVSYCAPCLYGSIAFRRQYVRLSTYEIIDTIPSEGGGDIAFYVQKGGAFMFVDYSLIHPEKLAASLSWISDTKVVEKQLKPYDTDEKKIGRYAGLRCFEILVMRETWVDFDKQQEKFTI